MASFCILYSPHFYFFLSIPLLILFLSFILCLYLLFLLLYLLFLNTTLILHLYYIYVIIIIINFIITFAIYFLLSYSHLSPILFSDSYPLHFTIPNFLSTRLLVFSLLSHLQPLCKIFTPLSPILCKNIFLYHRIQYHHLAQKLCHRRSFWASPTCSGGSF